MVVTPGGASAETRVAARGASRSADPKPLETCARPVVPLSGSGSSTINAGGIGRAGCATCLGPHATTRTAAVVTRSAAGLTVDMRALGAYGYGSTWMATVVPR